MENSPKTARHRVQREQFEYKRLRDYANVHDHRICNTMDKLKSDSIYLFNDLLWQIIEKKNEQR